MLDWRLTPRHSMSHPPAAGNLASAPLYKQVKLALTRSLSASKWRPGDAIPSETRLAREFKVSVGTIRKAVDELVADKILLRQQGRGTFVTEHTEDRQLYYFFHIVGKNGARVAPTHELLSLRNARAGPADRLLGMNPGDRVYRVHNLLRIAGRPVVFDEITLAAARFPGLTEKVFIGREGTIYGLYQARYGINVVRIVERISAQRAPAAVASVLGMRAESPILVIRRVAYSYHDAPVELRTSWVDTSGHEYLSDLWKAEGR